MEMHLIAALTARSAALAMSAAAADTGEIHSTLRALPNAPSPALHRQAGIAGKIPGPRVEDGSVTINVVNSRMSK